VRPLLSAIRDLAPVPYTSKRTGGVGGLTGLMGKRGDDRGSQLDAMGTVGTLFAIVNRTSTATAKAEWHLWRKAVSGNDDDRVEVTSHAALDVWNTPNDFFTRQEFVESVQQHIDLTGEGWPLLSYDPRVKFPIELWFARPDRMKPVTHPKRFIQGYVYTDPDGEEVPLTLAEVGLIRMPNPSDPYRGMGVVQALLSTIDSIRYSTEWNRRFFLNDATPGGLIEVEKRLSDEEWEEMQLRWNETHRGIGNAHRVGIIEQGKWATTAKFTMRDMQFVDLQRVGREVIREAFGMPSFMIGLDDIPNRATAESGITLFHSLLTVPRLDRWKGWLNNDFLPLFGATATGLEFDYDSPVEEDKEVANAERESKANAAKLYVEAHFDGNSVKDALELPESLVWLGVPAAPSPPGVPSPAPGGDGQPEDINVPEPPANQLVRHDEWSEFVAQLTRLDRFGATDTRAVVNAIDLDKVQLAWERRLGKLMRAWTDVAEHWRDRLYDQMRSAVNHRNPKALSAMSVPTADAADVLTDAMVDMASTAAGHVVDEAADQDVAIQRVVPPRAELGPVAEAVASLLGQSMSNSAAREALRTYTADADGDTVASDAVKFLRSLSTASTRDSLGGALTRAQNAGRLATLRAAPRAQYFAHEKLDGNTCAPCRHIDGEELPTLDAATLAYGGGPYIFCEGLNRCRGTMVAVWDATAAQGPEAPAPAAPETTGAKRVPADAKPFHRQLDAGLTEMSELVADVRKADRAGKLEWKRLAGGASAETKMGLLDDGRKVISKQAQEWGDPDAPRTQADAEQLASLVGRALDVSVPRAYRTDAESVWLEMMSGRSIGELEDINTHRIREYEREIVERLVNSDEGRRMGLFHALVAHNDPNHGNIMIDSDDRLVSIDHGFAFAMRGETADPADVGGNVLGKPVESYVLRADLNEWRATNPLTLSDVAEVRRRLKALRADFRKLGRESWFDGMLSALDELAERAAGKVDLYG
jgi:HK97 family phage portal protein